MPVNHVDENYRQVEKYMKTAHILEYIMQRPEFSDAIQKICIDCNVLSFYPELNSELILTEICDAIRFKIISIQQTTKNYIKE